MTGSDVKRPELGLPGLPGPGEEIEALAKGLLRRDVEPWPLNDMLRRGHEQQFAVLLLAVKGTDRDARVE